MKWDEMLVVSYRLANRLRLPRSLYRWADCLVNTQFLVSVIGVITDADERVLLFRHSYRRISWGLPGGAMTCGETPFTAIEREACEESGLIVQADRVLLMGSDPNQPDLEFVVHARHIGGDFRPSAEVTEARWFPPDALPPLPCDHLQILDQVSRLAYGEMGWYANPTTRC